MKKIVDGVYIEMTDEEIAEQMNNEPAEEAVEDEQHSMEGERNRPMSDAELLSAILAGVQRGEMPEAAEGYVLKEVYQAQENRTVWEYVSDPYYTEN